MVEGKIFRNLSEKQYEEIKDSLAYVTVLIAGADGKIDEQELNWAEKLTRIRTYADPESLNAFYAEVEEGFKEKVNQLVKKLPSDTSQRQEEISKKLKGLNDILPLLDNKIAYQIYDSLTSFAQHIAKASGGFLRFGSISKEEKKWVALPMIHPIVLHEEEE